MAVAKAGIERQPVLAVDVHHVLAQLAAIHLAWPMALVWMSVPISWLVCLEISYGWVKSGIWKRLEVSVRIRITCALIPPRHPGKRIPIIRRAG